ncbi:hypothetical protein WJX73_003663 [Symbiochloris irregularis]|uniref:Uncharacterized protein n=1 Tax=Symbiochloris irregularis TaxID=706552 RepID=A0AAW1NSA8_9CHLO
MAQQRRHRKVVPPRTAHLLSDLPACRRQLQDLLCRAMDLQASTANVQDAWEELVWKAENWSELLKALQRTSHHIQEISDNEDAAAMAKRADDLIGLHVLFFVCVPPQPQGQDVLRILKQLPEKKLYALCCGDVAASLI